MKIIIEVDVTSDNQTLNPELVTRRFKNRLTNADVNILSLAYEDADSLTSVNFTTTIKSYTAVDT